jgi:hypothetical protein
LCCILNGSCNEDIYSPDWDPVDYDAVVQRLAEPTGTLVNDSPQQTADAIVAQLGAAPVVVDDALLLYQQLEIVLDVMEESQNDEQESNTVSKGTVRGTNIYARISCLGSNLRNRSVDFADGEIRLEGSDFSLDDALKSGFNFGGDVLVGFRECRMNDKTFHGSNPAFASVGTGEFLIDLDLAVVEDDKEQRRVRYLLLIARNLVLILVDTDENGTYVLSLKVGGGLEIAIITAEGFFGCAIGGSGLECGSDTASGS